MARASLNLADLDAFRAQVSATEVSFENALSQFHASCEHNLYQIEDGITEMERAIAEIEATLEPLRQKIESLRQELSALQSALAATPPTIEVVTTDEEGNTVTSEEPNPEYAALESQIASVEAQLAPLEAAESRLEATKSRCQEAISSLRRARSEILDLQEDINNRAGEARGYNATAHSRLNSIEGVLNDYLALSIVPSLLPRPVNPFAGTAFYSYGVPSAASSSFKQAPAQAPATLRKLAAQAKPRIAGNPILPLVLLQGYLGSSASIKGTASSKKIDPWDSEESLPEDYAIYHHDGHLLDEEIAKRMGHEGFASFAYKMHEAIKRDYEATLEETMRKHNCSRHDAILHLNEILKDKPISSHIVSDLFGGLSSNWVRGYFSHDLAYWGRSDGEALLGAEGFAELFAAEALEMNASLEFSSRYLKETIEVYQKIKEEASDALDQ